MQQKQIFFVFPNCQSTHFDLHFLSATQAFVLFSFNKDENLNKAEWISNKILMIHVLISDSFSLEVVVFPIWFNVQPLSTS